MESNIKFPPCEPFHTHVIGVARDLWHQINGLDPDKEYCPHWLQQDDVEFSYILRLLYWWRPKKVLEIGYGLGGVALCLHLLFPYALIVNVETEDYMFFPDTRKETVRYAHQVAKWLSKRGRWKFVYGDSKDIKVVDHVRRLYGKFDVLIIDGDHRLESVISDFTLYSPLVRDGGLILFHDSREDNQKPGIVDVYDAIKQLGLRGYKVENPLSPSPGFFWLVFGV